MKIEFTFDMSNCEFNIDKINEIVSYEIDKCCHDIEAEAKHLCPVDTGALKDSITTDNLTDTSGEVFTNMDYCECVEYGTIHMSAQPYMMPAFDHQSKIFEEELENKTSEEL